MWEIRYLPLSLVDPVPSDIKVARSQTPKHVTELAKEIGLLAREVQDLVLITVSYSLCSTIELVNVR